MLYNLSLLPLYVIYFIRCINFNYLVYFKKFHVEILHKYGIIFFILIIISFISLIFIKNYFKENSKLMDKITNITRKEYEYFTFLSVFILPLFGISLKSINDIIELFSILFFMGVIYIKGDFLYLNPIFLIFGWYLYEGYYKGKKIVFLSDDRDINETITKGFVMKQIGKNFYFVKKL